MTAAHAGYGSERIPVGGAAAVCERLCAEWAGRVDVTLLGPGPEPPEGVRYQRVDLLDRPPSALGELRYARFCRDFERETTRRILDGPEGPVIAHDLSEGPDFGALARAGRRVVALVHVDVVEYFARIYLRGAVSAATAAHAFARLSRLPVVPDLLRLVFDKQAAAARHATHLVVPSPGMEDVLRACYPDMPGDRVVVLPWGASPQLPASPEARSRLQADWGLASDDAVLITLSRISPEKGQDLLLEAIAEGERRGEVPPNVRVIICGEAAYMKGPSFLKRLRSLAGRLRTPVLFPGHLGGERKRAALEMATLFVSPSRHESYGLTTMEALSAGLPVVGVRTHGLEATVDDACGVLIEPGADAHRALWSRIRTLLDDADARRAMSGAATDRASTQRFSDTAERLLELLR